MQIENKLFLRGGQKMKRKIGDFRSKGGLKSKGLMQRALFEYITSVNDLNHKLCINIGMEYKYDHWREEPSSLRFDSFEEALRFLDEFIMAMTYYGYYSGTITNNNASWKLATIQKIVSEKYIWTLKSV